LLAVVEVESAGKPLEDNNRTRRPMPKQNDLSRSLVALEQDATLIAVIEMGQSSWLVAGIVPGLERNPLKKLTPDRDGLLQLLHRWRKEAEQAGRLIKADRRRL
jgi:transposase